MDSPPRSAARRRSAPMVDVEVPAAAREGVGVVRHAPAFALQRGADDVVIAVPLRHAVVVTREGETAQPRGGVRAALRCAGTVSRWTPRCAGPSEPPSSRFDARRSRLSRASTRGRPWRGPRPFCGLQRRRLLPPSLPQLRRPAGAMRSLCGARKISGPGVARGPPLAPSAPRARVSGRPSAGPLHQTATTCAGSTSPSSSSAA